MSEMKWHHQIGGLLFMTRGVHLGES